RWPGGQLGVRNGSVSVVRDVAVAAEGAEAAISLAPPGVRLYMNADLQSLGARRPLDDRSDPPGPPGRGRPWVERDRVVRGRAVPHLPVPLRPPRHPRVDLDLRRHGRSPHALLRLARRPQDPRRDRDRRGVGDGDGPTLFGQLVRIARGTVLAAHDLHLRGGGPDDVGEGKAVVRQRELGRRPRNHVPPIVTARWFPSPPRQSEERWRSRRRSARSPRSQGTGRDGSHGEISSMPRERRGRGRSAGPGMASGPTSWFETTGPTAYDEDHRRWRSDVRA